MPSGGLLFLKSLADKSPEHFRINHRPSLHVISVRVPEKCPVLVVRNSVRNCNY